MHVSCMHSWLLVNSGTVSAVMTAKVNKQATDLCFRPGSETLVLYMARHTRHLSFHFLYRLHRHVYAHIYFCWFIFKGSGHSKEQIFCQWAFEKRPVGGDRLLFLCPVTAETSSAIPGSSPWWTIVQTALRQPVLIQWMM